MNGIPPASPSDSEDVAWALETADALWKRGERVDAVVWVRRAAQAAGEGEDSKRAAALARYAAELGDWIGAHTIAGESGSGKQAVRTNQGGQPSLAELDALLSDPPHRGGEELVVSSRDVEAISSTDFEAGFHTSAGEVTAENEVMTVSLGAPDLEIVDDDPAVPRVNRDDYDDDDETPARGHILSPHPQLAATKQPPHGPSPVPSAAEAHAGMLDPWADAESSRGEAATAARPAVAPHEFEQNEVVTSARRSVPKLPIPPVEHEDAASEASVPPAPRAPQFPQPRARAQPQPVASAPAVPSLRERLGEEDNDDEVETTTYRQINPRSRPEREQPANRATSPARPPAAASEPRVPTKGPIGRPVAPRMPGKSSDEESAPQPKPARHPVPEEEMPQPKPARHAVSEAATKPPRPPARSASDAPQTKPQPPTVGPPKHRPAPPAKAPSMPPTPDLLEMVDSVDIVNEDAVELLSDPPPPAPSALGANSLTPIPSGAPTPVPPTPVPPTPVPEATLSRAPTPRPGAVTVAPTGSPSDSPTAPPPVGALAPPDAIASNLPTRPPESVPAPASAQPSVPVASSMPTRPPESAPASSRGVAAPPPPPPPADAPLLDLSEVEALADLPDDARDAFGRAAKVHEVATDEEVSHFALALVVSGTIDVSATIVDAPAVHLERNAILRSRGTVSPGVGLRLVCSSEKAVVATWDEAAVEAAFRACPWVEEDLRAVADRVQAQAGMTMGPLGERFDYSLREHMTSKLVVRVLAPGEILVAEGKPVPIAIVGIGELTLTKGGAKDGALGPGEFLFPSQILAHGKAPATVTAGDAGAVVLYGNRAVSQELLMSFPPLLEVLATL